MLQETEDGNHGEDFREALNDKKAMKDLLESKGWKILERILKAQLDTRINHIVYGDNMEEKVREYMRGEAQILKLVLSLPSIEFENATELARSLSGNGR